MQILIPAAQITLLQPPSQYNKSKPNSQLRLTTRQTLTISQLKNYKIKDPFLFLFQTLDWFMRHKLNIEIFSFTI